MEISFPECWQYAVDRVGAYFTVDTVFDTTPGVPGALPVTPQAEFHDPAFYTNEAVWMHVEDTIVAADGERYMIIGSFTNNAGTNVLFDPAPLSAAYYYFDAVQVVDVTVIEGIFERLEVAFNAGSLNIAWPGVAIVDRIVLVDLLGKVVLEQSTLTNTSVPFVLNRELEAGTYVVHAWSDNKQATGKWTKVE